MIYILISLLILSTFFDLKKRIIPDSITLPGMILGLILHTFFGNFLFSFLGILIGGGTLLIFCHIGNYFLKKETLGGGDIKLIALVGSFIGWKLTLLAIFLAPFFGILTGMFFKKRIIPYAPSLTLASFISIFWGSKIIGFIK